MLDVGNAASICARDLLAIDTVAVPECGKATGHAVAKDRGIVRIDAPEDLLDRSGRSEPRIANLERHEFDAAGAQAVDARLQLGKHGRANASRSGRQKRHSRAQSVTARIRTSRRARGRGWEQRSCQTRSSLEVRP